MRVAVNTRLLIKNKMDGIGRYAFEVLKEITKNNPEVEFHFIFDRKFGDEFIFNKNIIPHVLSPKTRHPILWHVWFEIQLPRLLEKIKPDVFFSPDGFIPKYYKCPSINTIHDINFEHRPKDLKWAHSIFYRTYFKQYAKLSSHIITVSQYSKKDIMKTYKIKNNKIDVIYNGVSKQFNPVSLNNQKRIMDFVAIAAYSKKYFSVPLQFVIIGKEGEYTYDQVKAILRDNQVAEYCRLEEYKSEIDIWYEAIDILIAPSVNEAFGRNIIEGIERGAAIVAANSGGHTEIIDDESIGELVDVGDITGYLKAVHFLLSNVSKMERKADDVRTTIVERYNTKRICSQIVNEYKSLATSLTR